MSLQSCWLCDAMDCSLPGSTVQEILQARILEWIAISFSRGSFQPRDGTHISCTTGRFFTTSAKNYPGCFRSVVSINSHCIPSVVNGTYYGPGLFLQLFLQHGAGASGGCMAKNWCFWTMVLEKTLESPLDCEEIQPVHPKGDQSWVFIGRTDVEAETLILGPRDGKNWFIWKEPNAGKDWRREEKGTTEDKMAGWNHRLNGHEFE